MRAASSCRSSTERKDPRRIDASRAFFLIFIGLFKKVVIANFLATQIVDVVFASPNRHSSLEMLVGVYAYAVQIYADFSGYTDMAIGLALLLGFRFPQNFDGPYTATSLQDFWRRWHMTLSRWLRDYLYIPLGGNRGGTLADVPQPDAHVRARRPLARRGLDVRGVGRDPRRRSSARALAPDAPRTASGLPDPPDTAWRRWGDAVRHLPDRVLRLGLLPRRVVHERVRTSSPDIFDPSHWGDAVAARDRSRCCSPSPSASASSTSRVT